MRELRKMLMPLARGNSLPSIQKEAVSLRQRTMVSTAMEKKSFSSKKTLRAFLWPLSRSTAIKATPTPLAMMTAGRLTTALPSLPARSPSHRRDQALALACFDHPRPGRSRSAEVAMQYTMPGWKWQPYAGGLP